MLSGGAWGWTGYRWSDVTFKEDRGLRHREWRVAVRSQNKMATTTSFSKDSSQTRLSSILGSLYTTSEEKEDRVVHAWQCMLKQLCHKDFDPFGSKLPQIKTKFTKCLENTKRGYQVNVRREDKTLTEFKRVSQDTRSGDLEKNGHFFFSIHFHHGHLHSAHNFKQISSIIVGFPLT